MTDHDLDLARLIAAATMGGLTGSSKIVRQLRMLRLDMRVQIATLPIPGCRTVDEKIEWLIVNRLGGERPVAMLVKVEGRERCD